MKAFYLNTHSEPRIGDKVFRYGEYEDICATGEVTQWHVKPNNNWSITVLWEDSETHEPFYSREMSLDKNAGQIGLLSRPEQPELGGL